jgi:pantoate--beta-alanine ligase
VSWVSKSREWVNTAFTDRRTKPGNHVNKPIHSAPDAARTRTDLQAKVRAWRRAGETIALVPTMGALHDGHLSLVEKARETASRVIVSIFVNPAQFAPGEDFDAYPRREAEDIAKLNAIGVDLIYLPNVAEMYPAGSCTDVRVSGLSDLLDGVHRPHFFYGVTTIVARLFLHAQPDIAVFGEKDFQQLQIIRRMTADLGFAINIIGGETRREQDGLAQSSRNVYLTADQRRQAGALYAALHRARLRLALGAPAGAVLAEASAHVIAAGFSKLDYLTLVDSNTLLPLTALAPGMSARLLVAAWLGTTRLIDNIDASV